MRYNNDVPTLNKDPTLGELQEYYRLLCQERGFTNNTPQDDALYLGEEVGELFKAIRKTLGHKLDPQSKVGTVEEEAVDVLMYLLAIANHFNVDLEQAFRDKEERNKRRVWQ